MNGINRSCAASKPLPKVNDQLTNTGGCMGVFIVDSTKLDHLTQFYVIKCSNAIITGIFCGLDIYSFSAYIVFQVHSSGFYQSLGLHMNDIIM